jgi:uncharacterized membrane protein
VKTKHFLNKLEHGLIHRAITEAERDTSGDIVVYISHKTAPDALAAAQEVFAQRKLEKASDDNNLLFYLAPRSQTFAAVGGKALHDRVGQAWWDELVGLLGNHFRDGKFTDGLVAAIDRAGHALRRHFPAANTDRTGQSDIVEE